MRPVQLQKSYNSPRHKLLRFFEESRNQWKTKCRQAKADLKRLKNRIRWLESRKQQLQARLTTMRQENARLNALNQHLSNELSMLKKNARNRTSE